MSIMSWIKSMGKPKPKKYKGSVYSIGLMSNKILVADYEMVVKYDEYLSTLLWDEFRDKIAKTAYASPSSKYSWYWTSEEV